MSLRAVGSGPPRSPSRPARPEGPTPAYAPIDPCRRLPDRAQYSGVSPSAVIQGQVQSKNVHARLPENAEGAPLDVPLDEHPHRFDVELALTRHAGDLVERRRGADMRV